MNKAKKIRTLAIHLPQFHTIPENDAWWGKGFTEWTNVKKAKPLFKGHYQPHIPATDLGYYDLANPTTLVAQAKLAQAHGIHGFCFYHYWFNGKKVLERPIEHLLQSGKPDFPFCLCWANENWTRRWDGQEKNILLKQDYNFEDDRQHFNYLLPFFQDKRYIKVAEKPVFFVYRTELFPDIQKTVKIWREMAWQYKMELYLINVESFKKGIPPKTLGFDAAMDFQPNWQNMPPRKRPSLIKSLLHELGLRQEVTIQNKVYNYAALVAKIITKNPASYKKYPCVVPMWDNTARRAEGAIILNQPSPKLYEKWLKNTLKTFKPYTEEENFVLINAWNEWAEGNHLEPCQKFGNQYLKATKKCLAKYCS